MAEKMTKEEWYNQLFLGLGRSKFRSSFHLKQKDIDYINEKDLVDAGTIDSLEIMQIVVEIEQSFKIEIDSDDVNEDNFNSIEAMISPAVIPNDGKQTPMKGHPVFVAQHATATCCRECIRKWHKIQPGRELSRIQQEYLVDVIMTWIEKEMSERK